MPKHAKHIGHKNNESSLKTIMDEGRKREGKKKMSSIKTVMDEARKKDKKGGTNLGDVMKGNMSSKSGLW